MLKYHNQFCAGNPPNHWFGGKWHTSLEACKEELKSFSLAPGERYYSTVIIDTEKTSDFMWDEVKLEL